MWPLGASALVDGLVEGALVIADTSEKAAFVWLPPSLRLLRVTIFLES